MTAVSITMRVNTTYLNRTDKTSIAVDIIEQKQIKRNKEIYLFIYLFSNLQAI